MEKNRQSLQIKKKKKKKKEKKKKKKKDLGLKDEGDRCIGRRKGDRLEA